jgi:hypothetical protein
VSGLACRCLGDVDGPAGNICGEQSKPAGVIRI